MAATAAAVVVAGTTPPTQPRARASGSPRTAAELLVKIASAAASQPSPAVRDGEFMYIRSEVAYTTDTISGGRETSTMAKRHERQIWLPVANLCVTGLLIENGERTPLSPLPVAKGKADRSAPPQGTPPPQGAPQPQGAPHRPSAARAKDIWATRPTGYCSPCRPIRPPCSIT